MKSIRLLLVYGTLMFSCLMANEDKYSSQVNQLLKEKGLEEFHKADGLFYNESTGKTYRLTNNLEKCKDDSLCLDIITNFYTQSRLFEDKFNERKHSLEKIIYDLKQEICKENSFEKIEVYYKSIECVNGYIDIINHILKLNETERDRYLLRGGRTIEEVKENNANNSDQNP